MSFLKWSQETYGWMTMGLAIIGFFILLFVTLWCIRDLFP